MTTAESKKNRRPLGHGQHGSRALFESMTHGVPVSFVARRLRRSILTIESWKQGKKPVPWWAVELLMLQDFMEEDVRRQIGVSLAARGLPSGPHQPLRKSITQVVFEAIDHARRDGVELTFKTDIRQVERVDELGVFVIASSPDPRHTLEAKRPSGSPVGRGLTTRR